MANTIGLLKSDDGPPEGRQYCPEGVGMGQIAYSTKTRHRYSNIGTTGYRG